VLCGAALALALAPGLTSCNCDKSNGVPDGGQSIPCSATTPCPAGLTCDEHLGTCVNGDGGVVECTVALPGCPCADGDPPIACTISQDVVASCMSGQSLCTGGRYAACAAVPNVTCDSIGVDQGQIPLTPDNSQDVQKGLDGDIILNPNEQQVSFGYLWIANTGENTVSKIDVDTGKEVARYASVRGASALGVTAVPLGGYGGDAGNCGNCPSRTAIDFNGDAFVANRAFGIQGTVTKFANAAQDCVDRNNNGVIETSVDANGDGMIDVTDPAEFKGEDDECILWTKPVGDVNGIPRALAIDAGGPDGENGNVWVGLYGEHRVVQISGNTGDPIAGGSVDLSKDGHQVAPYGAAIDSAGHVWVTELSGEYLARVDSLTKTLIDLYPGPDHNGTKGFYGIAVDVEQRVWLAGYSARDVKVFLPASGEWKLSPIQDDNTRGIAIDAGGNVWFAMTGGTVGRVKGDDVVSLGESATVTLFTIPDMAQGQPQGINNTIGVGIDRNGACWVVSRNDGLAKGAASRIKPDGTMDSFPVGKNPYTYSDFTGYGLLTVVRPQGWFRVPVAGCPDGSATHWRTLSWIETEPAGTAVRLKVRVADTLAALANAAWYGPWDAPPVDLQAAGVPASAYLEVEVDLSSANPDVTPHFGGFNVTFDPCGVGPG
jgi:streptogramin lyase